MTVIFPGGDFFDFNNFIAGNISARSILVAYRGMLGLQAWADGLVVVLFEFLDDDTKLAQSCRYWLNVQHWYVVAPYPAMRVTLWALMASKREM